MEVSALGVGTWAMGGPFSADGRPRGRGPTDDDQSARALRRAYDLGVTLYDTADAYGTGHAEELLGTVFAHQRDRVIIATKWGHVLDPAGRRLTGRDGSPRYLRRALTESLRRLRTDYLDVYQLHLADLPVEQAIDLREECEKLVAEGLIRTYGWSTDDPDRAAAFGEGPGCGVVQCEANVLRDRQDMYPVADRHDLAILCRGPLAMGLLTGRDWSRVTPPADDVRNDPPPNMPYFRDGRPSPHFAARRDSIRDILTSGGRTVVQGALAWLWAASPRTVPIPGCRTVAQVEDVAGALDHGPLGDDDIARIRHILAEVHPPAMPHTDPRTVGRDLSR